MELTVVLVGVEHPGNLGAVARAMKNFGVRELLLIDPRCNPSDEEAKNRAKWANDVLAAARTTTTLDVLEAYDLVVGTTAQLGDDFNIVRTPLTPAQLATELAGREGKVALLFGRESDGLRNEELRRCDLAVTIPTNPNYPTLNLSHAVAVILSTLTTEEHTSTLGERYPLVKAQTKERLLAAMDGLLDAMPFPTPEKRETQRRVWRRLLGNAFLTQREAMALLGLLKRMKAQQNTPTSLTRTTRSRK